MATKDRYGISYKTRYGTILEMLGLDVNESSLNNLIQSAQLRCVYSFSYIVAWSSSQA